MTILERVKQLTEDQKMTIAELERKLDFSQGSISRWRTQSPSSERLKKVAEFFGVTTDYLLGVNNTPKWADQNDIIDLKNFLGHDEDMNGFSFGGKKLTEREKEQMRVAVTQVFWDKLKEHKK